MTNLSPTSRPVGLAAALLVGCLLTAPAAFGLSGMAMKALCAEASDGDGDKAVAGQERAAGEAAFAAREDWARAADAIVHFEESLAADPEQLAVRVLGARAYYLFADGKYRFDEDDEKQLDAFAKGARHAARAIRSLNPAFVRKVCSNAPAAEPPTSEHPCRALYKRLLDYVLQAPLDRTPEIEAEQLIEKEKARLLLEEIDTYFPPA